MRPEIEKKITENSNPLKVNLVDLKILDHEILDIMTTIKKVKPSMTTIDLDKNNIGDEGAKILSEQILDFDAIKEISLQFNQIGREGAIALFSLKKKFSELDILFHGNKITNVSEMDKIEHLALVK